MSNSFLFIPQKTTCILCVYTIILIWAWSLLKKDSKYKVIDLHTLLNLNQFKTGDIILMKSVDDLNSIYLFSYFTHMGIVIIDPILTNNEPYIFEAVCINGKKNDRESHFREPGMLNHSGICLTPLKNRIEKYMGYSYYKPLSRNITNEMHLKLINFMFYAKDNMYYNYNLMGNAFCKGILKSKCTNGTNCAELVFLSLINMGLLNEELWHNPIFHYLKFICNLKELDNKFIGNPKNSYYYTNPIEIYSRQIDSII